MYGTPKTREQLRNELGLKKKALSDFLRREVQMGRLIRRMVFKNPSMGGGVGT